MTTIELNLKNYPTQIQRDFLDSLKRTCTIDSTMETAENRYIDFKYKNTNREPIIITVILEPSGVFVKPSIKN